MEAASVVVVAVLAVVIWLALRFLAQVDQQGSTQSRARFTARIAGVLKLEIELSRGDNFEDDLPGDTPPASPRGPDGTPPRAA